MRYFEPAGIESSISLSTVDFRGLNNQSFLDDAIAAGDDFLLATPIDQIYPGSYLEREVDSLLSRGYLLSPDGWALLAP